MSFRASVQRVSVLGVAVHAAAVAAFVLQQGEGAGVTGEVQGPAYNSQGALDLEKNK